MDNKKNINSSSPYRGRGLLDGCDKDMEDYSHMCNLSLGIEERAMEKARKESTTEIIKKYIAKRCLSGASDEEIKRDLLEYFDLEPKEIENYISNFKY